MVKIRKQFLKAVARHFLWALSMLALAQFITSLVLLDITGLIIAITALTFLIVLQLRSRRYTKNQLTVVSWRSTWLVLFAYASFGLYFGLRGLGLAGIDASHVVARQAFTATSVTLLLLLGYYVARLHPVLRPSGKSITGVLKLLVIFAPLFIFVWLASCEKLASKLLLGPIDGQDWLVAIGLTTLFMLILETQERTMRHGRHGLVDRHGHNTVKKHLPPKKPLRKASKKK